MLQGTLNPESDYPESFFTFWNFDTPETRIYNNKAHAGIWGFWIFFYSNDPETVERESNAVIELLKKENDIILEGKGSDAKSDAPTHTGRMLTCYIIENYGGN